MRTKAGCLIAAIALLTVGWTTTASAQVERGDVRVGAAFDVSAAEHETNAELDLGLGYSVTDRIEPGVVLSMVKREGEDAYGVFGADLIYHLLPASRLVPGVGGAVGRTFGHHGREANIYELFFNLDAFAAPSWSVNLRTGWERHAEESHSEDAFILRVGVSVFLKPAHHGSAH